MHARQQTQQPRAFYPDIDLSFVITHTAPLEKGPDLYHT